MDAIKETPEEVKEERDETDLLGADGGSSTRLISMVNDWLSSWMEELAFVQHSKAAATKKPSKYVHQHYNTIFIRVCHIISCLFQSMLYSSSAKPDNVATFLCETYKDTEI